MVLLFSIVYYNENQFRKVIYHDNSAHSNSSNCMHRNSTSNLKAAVEWYGKILGLKVIGEFQDSWKEAMLQFPGNPIGVPTVYLVQTDSQDRLKFYNTNYGYTQSIIDFYTADLAEFHRRLKAHGVATNRKLLNYNRVKREDSDSLIQMETLSEQLTLFLKDKK